MNAITRPAIVALPLTACCPNCTDGIATTNDPASARRCPVCDGSGERTLICDGWNCDGDAVLWFAGDKYCAACATITKADALWVGEDAI